MYEPPIELTPEAEWLLQSGQIEAQILAEALVEEYGAFLYQLASILLYDPQAAARVVTKTLERALQQAYRYRSKTSVRAWLLGFARQVLRRHPVGIQITPNQEQDALSRALAALDEDTRLAALLHWLFDWPLAEIEQVAGLRRAANPSALETAHADCLAALAQPGSQPTDETPDKLLQSAQLKQALQERWPVSPDTVPSWHVLATKAAQTARRRAVRQRYLNNLAEIFLLGLGLLTILGIVFSMDALLPDETTPRHTLSTPLWQENVPYVVLEDDTVEQIAALADMSVEELRRLNQLDPAEPLYVGQPLWVAVPPLRQEDSILRSPSPVVEPLDLHASVEDIVQRMRQNQALWQTLWIDMQMIIYTGSGSENQVGRAYRFQAWVQQPDRSMELFSIISEAPVYRHIILMGRRYTSAVPYASSYLSPDWKFPPRTLLNSPLLRAMIFPGEGYWDVAERVNLSEEIGIQELVQIAGRQALAIKWKSILGDHMFRLWVDTQTGVLLRFQEYDQISGSLSTDRMVTAITYDAQIPVELFDPRIPWLGNFAHNAAGQAQPFDPSQPVPTLAFPLQNP